VSNLTPVIHWVSTAFGYLMLVVLSLWFLVLAVERAMDTGARLLEGVVANAERNARRDVGRMLMSQCHWFSESNDAWSAVQEVGRDLVESGGFDVSEVRERWRKRRDAGSQGGAT
jgi:hypothetical protein